MKTQIIQLEAHDDTLSVRDKMDWSQTPRVLLVWPQTGKVLRTRLDLVLLERYCSSHGSQLAVLTTDREVIFQAGKAGIPVFQSRSEAQLQPWGKSFREFERQELQQYAAEKMPAGPLERREAHPRGKLPLWARIPIFTLGVLSVIALAGFLLPSAEISFAPRVRELSLTIPVQAQPGRSQITLSGLLPARELTVIVEGQLSIPATGETPVPAEYARGEVIFTNLGEDSITIQPETILSSTGETPVLFRTLTGGSTPPSQGGQISLEVEALLPGESGNLPANQITKINLAAGADLAVTNPLPTEGGADIMVPAPKQADRLELGQEMTRLLEQRSQEEIETVLGDQDVLLTTRLEEYEVVLEEFSPQGDAPGELLWLDRTVQYLVYYVSADDLQILATDLVKAQYQDDPFQPDLASILVESTTAPERQSGDIYHWDIQVSWRDRQTVSREEVTEMAATKQVEEARQALKDKLDLEELPQIILRPGWWPRIPVLPFRIQVRQGEG